MRLFIAVNCDDEVKRQIVKLQERLRAQAVRGNFSRPENLHVTLAFLGETPEARLDCLYHIVESVQVPPFEITFNHTGYFKRRSTELWWLGVNPADPGLLVLTALQKRLMNHLEEARFTVDKKPFSAHITLGREMVRQQPIALDCPPIPVRVERISLMKSEHIRGVLTYTEL